MGDELLGYYNRELTYIRRLATRFAEAHPKIAERLRLGSDDASDDPHVERMIESFAYLTARIRRKLDDEFPEITSALLDVLYPHYLAPIPSMAIVKFQLDPEQTQLTSGYAVARHAPLETESIKGEPCRFRTCYPVTLWPIEVTQAVLAQAPLPAPATSFSAAADSVLRLSLKCSAKETKFTELEIGSLRFFLKGQPQYIHRLYELIFNHTIGVAVARSMTDDQPVELGVECLGQVGFERDEGMLPYPARSFLAYRLLTEYFAFPQKFLFVDLRLPDPARLGRLENQMDIYLFLNQTIPELARNISADTFQLGCTPMVNLYSKRAEPIQLTQTEFEYQVVPDRRLPLSHEVYSIERVRASPPQGASVEYFPFFSIKHSLGRGEAKTYWHAARRLGGGGRSGGGSGDRRVPLAGGPGIPHVGAGELDPGDRDHRLNRDLPSDLPFGGDQPRLQLSEGRRRHFPDHVLDRPDANPPPFARGRPALAAHLAPVAQSPLPG